MMNNAVRHFLLPGLDLLLISFTDEQSFSIMRKEKTFSPYPALFSTFQP